MKQTDTKKHRETNRASSNKSGHGKIRQQDQNILLGEMGEMETAWINSVEIEK